MTEKRLFAFILAVVLMLPVMGGMRVNAAAKITQTVNLSRPQKNESGPGYYWDNRKDTLTLDGLFIETTDEFGLKVPQNATVILKGNNYITASRAALGIPGTVIFKGNGTLTLVADEMGMYFYSTDNSTTARFLNGTYTITSKGDGILSTNTAISFVDSTLKIDAPAADHEAITCRSIKLFGGNVTANNSIVATIGLELRGIGLSVESTKPALTCAQKLTITDVAYQTGSSKGALSKADAYNGDNCVVLKSRAVNLGTSVIFGESVPKFVDIILLLVFLLLVGCGIGIPFWRTYQKNKKAKEALAENERQAELAKKQ